MLYLTDKVEVFKGKNVELCQIDAEQFDHVCYAHEDVIHIHGDLNTITSVMSKHYRAYDKVICDEVKPTDGDNVIYIEIIGSSVKLFEIIPL